MKCDAYRALSDITPVFMERKDEKNQNLNPTPYSKEHSFSTGRDKKKDVLKFQAAQTVIIRS